jgi:hypothetical protein
MNILIFKDNQIGAAGATALSEYLTSNSSLQKLDLNGKFKLNEFILMFTDNQIGGKGATALSKYLKSNSSLQELNLECNFKKNFL